MVQWGRILPLAVFLVVLAVAVVVGLIVYSIVMDVKAKTKEKMKGKNVTLSRTGVTVALRELKDEDYKDRSQSILVDIWNYGNPFNAPKRRFWHRSRQSSGNGELLN